MPAPLPSGIELHIPARLATPDGIPSTQPGNPPDEFREEFVTHLPATRPQLRNAAGRYIWVKADITVLDAEAIANSAANQPCKWLISRIDFRANSAFR